MDWFSWLSKTGLEPSLIYEYGLDFSHNQLQLDDVRYLDHEFLQSMGISVAKHRLEILKLAKKETRFGHPKSLSRLSWALIRTKKCFSKYFNKLVFHEEVSFDGRGATRAKPPWYQEHWRGALLRKHKSYCEEVEDEKPMVVKTRSITLSGPLDGRTYEKIMTANKSPRLSGPLDGRVVSPKFCFPYEKEREDVDYDDHSLRTALFQDLKPT